LYPEAAGDFCRASASRKHLLDGSGADPALAAAVDAFELGAGGVFELALLDTFVRERSVTAPQIERRTKCPNRLCSAG
jgi:hypothetical protein